MKYERIKFYYIVWAILGFGPKHTLALSHTQPQAQGQQTSGKFKVKQ